MIYENKKIYPRSKHNNIQEGYIVEEWRTNEKSFNIA